MRKSNYFPDNWKIEQSQDYCFKVADGTHDTPKPVSEGKKLVTSKNIKQGRVNLDGCYFISENDFININRRSKVDRGDVLFSMIGTVGEIALVKEDPDYAIKNIGLFKPKSYMDGLWLYYYLTSQIGQSALDTYLTGTSQQFVSLGDLRKVPIVSPPEKIKRKITALLSAYDDLIENNNRRIAILEKMAEELYREWFVRLRFPGHEKVKIVKNVPEGWEIVEAKRIIRDVIKGKSYTSEEINEIGIGMPFISLKSVDRGGGYRTDGLKFYTGRYSESQVVQTGEVVLAVTDMTQDRAIVGRVARIPRGKYLKFSISLDIVKLVPDTMINNTILYATLRYSSFSESLKEFANGANVLHLKSELIQKQKIVLPKISLLKLYAEKVKPIYDEIDALMPTLENLQFSRDRLLSRLMSGKIDVENMDISFPASMQEEVVHA